METAIEWLEKELDDFNPTQIEWHNAIKKAKEIFKKQIIDACMEFSMHGNELAKQKGEEYYNLIYKKIMSREKGFCDVCGTEIEVTMCCSGHECGCMGLPTEPPICSEECYDTFMNQDYQDDKKAKQEFVFFKPRIPNNKKNE